MMIEKGGEKMGINNGIVLGNLHAKSEKDLARFAWSHSF